MRRYLFASTALLMFATPAAAKDGSWYGGFELGITFPKDPNGSAFIDYTTVNTPVPPATTLPTTGIPAGPVDIERFSGPFDFNTKTGWDGDIIVGYDFGMFRVEGELGYKRAGVSSRSSSAFLDELNVSLNRPSVAPDPGAPGLPALVTSDFRLDDSTHVWSGMLNGLVDFGGQEGIGGYLGVGAGYASVHAGGASSGKFAWQLIGGVYYPVSNTIDIGLKARYFQTGSVGGSDTFSAVGNPNRLTVPPSLVPNVDQTTSAVIGSDSNARFKTWSLLASVVYNFAPPPSPPPPPPPPPPPAPATQTCPDGSVIEATAMCPAPPPPPPPATQGERGR